MPKLLTLFQLFHLLRNLFFSQSISLKFVCFQGIWLYISAWVTCRMVLINGLLVSSNTEFKQKITFKLLTLYSITLIIPHFLFFFLLFDFLGHAQGCSDLTPGIVLRVHSWWVSEDYTGLGIIPRLATC